ncbi:MAG: chemotaxis protein CheB, partial [Syntrophomonadaceae bacterium]|nr:chemotaxis protein CheB [Syntrophomonadaceae bacterium]
MMEKKTSDQNPESFPTDLSEDYTAQTDVPIVAIGASAGGVEALTAFFNQVPDNSGLAFVVIQHMNPQCEDLLAEILQHATSMKVVQSRDLMAVAPNCVYTIPPNKKMTIHNGLLHVHDYYAVHTRPQPVNFFFESLADDEGPASLGVILCGTGADGAAGIRAIKASSGAVFVQDPVSAQFDGMPRSAIATGLADYIGAAESIPDQILAHLASQTPGRQPDLPPVVPRRSSYYQILDILQSATGH